MLCWMLCLEKVGVSDNHSLLKVSLSFVCVCVLKSYSSFLFLLWII